MLAEHAARILETGGGSTVAGDYAEGGDTPPLPTACRAGAGNAGGHPTLAWDDAVALLLKG